MDFWLKQLPPLSMFTWFMDDPLGQHHKHNEEGHKVRRLQRLLLHNNRHTMQFRNEGKLSKCNRTIHKSQRDSKSCRLKISFNVMNDRYPYPIRTKPIQISVRTDSADTYRYRFGLVKIRIGCSLQTGSHHVCNVFHVKSYSESTLHSHSRPVWSPHLTAVVTYVCSVLLLNQ